MKVLVPGSFDPITVGHLDIVRRIKVEKTAQAGVRALQPVAVHMAYRQPFQRPPQAMLAGFGQKRLQRG